jgi:hypothetical protein
LEGPEKTTGNVMEVMGIAVEIRQQHLLNTSPEYYRYTTVFGKATFNVLFVC